MKKLYLLVLLSIFAVLSVEAQTNYYYQSGNVDALTSWTLNSNGTGGNPANFTSTNQVFNIQGTKTVTSWSNSSAVWTISGSGSKVIVGDAVNSASLDIPAGNSIAGTVDVQIYSTLYVESNSSSPFTAGTFSSTAASSSSNSTLVYDGGTNQYLPSGSYFGALSISGTGTTVKLNGGITVGNGGSSSANSILTMTSGTTLVTNGSQILIKKGFTVPSGATLDLGSNVSIQPYSIYSFTVNSGATVISSCTSGLDGNINLYNTTTSGWFNATGINYVFNGASTTKMFCSIVAATTTSSAVNTSTSIPVTSATNIQIGQSIFNASTLIGTVTNIAGNTITASVATTLGIGAELNFRNPPAFGTYSTSAATTGIGVTFNVSSASGIVLGQSIYANSSASSAGTVTGLSGNTVTATLTSIISSGAYLNFRHSSTPLNIASLSIGANNTLNTPVTISGDLTLGTSATLSDNGNVISLSGNIAGSGSHSGVGEILMTSGGRNIAGVGLGNLEVAVGSGNTVSLTGSTTINGTLTLTSGYLNAGSNNLTLPGAALNANATSCIAGASNSNYIVLGSGLVKVKGVNTSATKNPSPVVFPIGTSTTSYTPLIFTGTTNAPDITIGLANTFTNSLNNSGNVVNLQWSILSSVANSSSITYQYNNSNITGTLSSSPILGLYSSGYVENALNAAVGTNPYSISTLTPINLPASTVYTGIGNAYCFAPAPPTIGTATSTASGQATISFTPSNLNSGSFTYSIVSTPTASITQSGNTSSPITVSGLTNGVNYAFRVIANNGTSNSVPCAASNSVTPLSVPGSPVIDSVKVGNSLANVYFHPTSTGGSNITSYKVYVNSTVVGTGTTSPITVTSLTNGVNYTFTITATNSLGEGAASASSGPVTPVTVPGTPNITSVTASTNGDSTAIVSFNAPSSTGGSAITAFTVTSNPGNITATGGASPITLHNLTLGTAYTFTVTASNSVGVSSASAASSSVTPSSVYPTPPTILPNTISALQTVPGKDSATVIFIPSTYLGINGTSVTYTVTSSPANITARVITGTTDTTDSIIVKGLSRGVLYTFTVTATNNLGKTSVASISSNSVWLTGFTVPVTGMIINDATLFDAMNLNTPGFDSVRYYVAQGNYQQAQYWYHQYRLSKYAPTWYFGPPGTQTVPTGNGTGTEPNADLISQNVIGADENGLAPTCYNFGLDVTKINWFDGQHQGGADINPSNTQVDYATFWGDMARFDFWRALYQTYMTTKNEKYTQAWVNQMSNWVASFPVDLTTYDDLDGNGAGTNGDLNFPFVLNNSKGAVTGNTQDYYPAVLQDLQEGNRMEDTWMNAFFTFIQSPILTDGAVDTFARGILWHGWRLNWGTENYMNVLKLVPYNHQMLGAAGLAVLAAEFPEFNAASTWKATAFQCIDVSLDSTVYPDGAETELAPGYHNWVKDFYITVAQVYNINKDTMPSTFLSKFKKMYWYDVYLTDPTGFLPQTNDNSNDVTPDVAGAVQVWGDPEFVFINSGGTQGKTPDTVSYHFPYAGFNVMRSGWDKNANFLFFKNNSIGFGYHGHEDMLHVSVTGFGSPLLIESGAYEYNHSIWQVYDYSTEAHNTITVDGKDQHRINDTTPTGIDSVPQKYVKAASTLPWLSNFVADYTTGTYNDGYQQHSFANGRTGSNNFANSWWTDAKDYSINHNRHVFFLKPYYYVVTDFLENSGSATTSISHSYQAYFNMNAPTAYLDSSSITKEANSLNTAINAQILLHPMETNGLRATQKFGYSTDTSLVGWIARDGDATHTTDYQQPIPAIIYSKQQPAPATFSTLLYPYNTQTKPTVNTTLLTSLMPGVWGSTGSTQYENFAIAIHRYNMPTQDTIQLTSPSSPLAFSAYAAVSVVRKLVGSTNTVATFDSLTKYYDSLTTFTPTQGNYIVMVDSSNNRYLYNDNIVAETVTFTKPVATTKTLQSHQWLEITPASIAAVGSPVVTLAPSSDTTLIQGDNVTLSANVTNLQIPIDSVTFYDGPIKIGVDYTYPYTFQWTAINYGFHNLTAKVISSSGQTVTSPIAQVSVGSFEAEDFTTNTSGTLTVDSKRSNDSIVTNIAAGGALTYGLKNTNTGKYSLSVTLLNNVAPNSISVTIDGIPISNNGVALTSLAVPISASYQTVITPSFDISSGSHALQVIFNNATPAVDYFQIQHLNYYNIPGLIQAQNYTYTGNLATNAANTPITVSQNPESLGGGTYIGNVDSNWVSYSVNVAQAGTYQLQFSMTNPYSSTNEHLDILDSTSTNVIYPTPIETSAIPTYTYTSGGAAFFNSKNSNITFTNAGPQTLQLNFYASSGIKNFAWINFAPLGLSTSITSPATNSTVTSGSSVTINASAAATGSSVSYVAFYNGDQLLGTDNTAPYSYTWNNLPAGTFRITSRVYDVNGNVFISSPITISAANQPPVVSGFAAPFTQTTAIIPYKSYAITTVSSDPDGTVAQVVFYNNGALIDADNSTPFTLNFSAVPNSVNNITAYAIDNLGDTSPVSPTLTLTGGIIQPQNYVAPLVGAVNQVCTYAQSGYAINSINPANNSLQYQVDVVDNARYLMGLSMTNKLRGDSIQWLVDGAPATLDSLPVPIVALDTAKLTNVTPLWLKPFDLQAGSHIITLQFSGNVDTKDTLNYVALTELKYQEIPATTTGVGFPATSYAFSGSDTAISSIDTLYPYTDFNSVVGTSVGALEKTWLAYPVYVDSAGSYTVTFKVSNKYSNNWPINYTPTNYNGPQVTTMRVAVVLDSAYQTYIPFPSYTWNATKTVIGFGKVSTTVNFTTPGKHILKFYFYGNIISFDTVWYQLIKTSPPVLTVWNGANNTQWRNANNWNNGLPSQYTDAIIPSLSTQPTVSEVDSVHNLFVYKNATMNINNADTLKVYDSLSNNGLIYANGLVNLVGTSSQLILGNGTISNLTLNNSCGRV